MLLAIIFIGLIFLPAVVAGGYDAINTNHTGLDVATVWIGTIIFTALIPLTIWLLLCS